MRDVLAVALRDPWVVIIASRTPDGFADEGGQPVVLASAPCHVVTDLLNGEREPVQFGPLRISENRGLR